MGTILQLHDPHEQVQMLLPWHVNGTLDPAESALVEAHLEECAECRADLEGEAALRSAIAATALEPDAPAEVKPVPRLRAHAGRRGSMLRRPIALGWALAGQASVAAAAVAAVALLSLAGPPRSSAGYHLLAANAPAPRANAIVLFAPDMAVGDVGAALAQAGARLVDGPTASGAFLVRVDEGRRTALLARLRATAKVVLAEPVDAAP